MSSEKTGRSRGLSSPAVPLSRANSFSSSSPSHPSPSSDNKGTLSHSLAQITSFMSTSFPHRSKRDEKSPRTTDVTALKEEFERKIAAVVFCLEEKAEENIDLSYKLKALQETSKQREAEKDRAIEELQRSLKSKEDEYVQLEKKANDEVLNELNRRIQTITHCLNDMAEENLKLRAQVNANAHKANLNNGKGAAGEVESIFEEPQLNIMKNKPKRRSKIALQDFPWDKKSDKKSDDHSPKAEAGDRIVKTGSFPGSGSPFSPPPSNASSFSMDNEVPSSASFLSSLAASSSILSTKPGSSSQASGTSTSSPSSSSTSSPSVPTRAVVNKVAPATASVSTNTSPVPTPASPPTVTPLASTPSMPTTTTTLTPTPTPAQAPAPTPIESAVADMKSEVLAEEILKDSDWLRKFTQTYLVPPPSAQSMTLLSDIIKQDKSRVETRVKLSLDDRIKELETQLTEHETNVTELKSKLERETDRTGSLSESVTEYEKKLKDLEGRMWDNLNKEAQRRTEAESKAKRLKKKVDELQFLLDELKDDGSDSEEEEEETAPTTTEEGTKSEDTTNANPSQTEV